MTRLGLIAIIRGVTPDRAIEVGRTLYDAGFRAIEVPLNSPSPLESIGLLRKALPATCRVGAGTVLSPEDVDKAAEAGAELIVSPNTDPRVIARTVERGLESYPGAATPTEAFTAVAAGASAVKLFPAVSIGVAGLKAWRSVLPSGTRLLPVGGVDVEDLATWAAAGADGAGIGTSLFRPTMSIEEVSAQAVRFTKSWESAVG